jgi:hypothetical protein
MGPQQRDFNLLEHNVLKNGRSWSELEEGDVGISVVETLGLG